MRVETLWVYPIKACGSVAVTSAHVTARGFIGDRRWMLVDDTGRFISQREVPALTLVQCMLDVDTMEVRAPNVAPLSMPRVFEHGPRVEVSVWGSHCEAVVHDAASLWFTRVFARPCRAVYMPEDVHRPIESASFEDVVSFADGFPYLLTTQVSLEALAARLDTPIGMNRFRPNIVVDGDVPFAEDDWTRVTIGDVVFRVAKGCDRCMVTTIDPETGETGLEPLRTLATFRRWNGKVWFGINLVPEERGIVRVGDPVRLG